MYIMVLRYVGVVDLSTEKGLSSCEDTVRNTHLHNSQDRMRGPGAGAEVTAGRVFYDILQLGSYDLGAPSYFICES